MDSKEVSNARYRILNPKFVTSSTRPRLDQKIDESYFFRFVLNRSPMYEVLAERVLGKVCLGLLWGGWWGWGRRHVWLLPQSKVPHTSYGLWPAIKLCWQKPQTDNRTVSTTTLNYLIRQRYLKRWCLMFKLHVMAIPMFAMKPLDRPSFWLINWLRDIISKGYIRFENHCCTTTVKYTLAFNILLTTLFLLFPSW